MKNTHHSDDDSLRQDIDSAIARGQVIAANLHAFNNDVSSDTPEGVLAAGKICELGADLQRAIHLYTEAGARAPKLFEAKARLAFSQLKAGLLEAGLRTAKDLTDQAPDFSFPSLLTGEPTSSMTVLGDALRLSGSNEAALEAYKKALEIEPRDNYSAARCAQLLIEAGKAREASPLIDQIDPSGRFQSLIAAFRLSTNDPSLLPTIDGFKENSVIMGNAK